MKSESHQNVMGAFILYKGYSMHALLLLRILPGGFFTQLVLEILSGNELWNPFIAN